MRFVRTRKKKNKQSIFSEKTPRHKFAEDREKSNKTGPRRLVQTGGGGVYVIFVSCSRNTCSHIHISPVAARLRVSLTRDSHTRTHMYRSNYFARPQRSLPSVNRRLFSTHERNMYAQAVTESRVKNPVGFPVPPPSRREFFFWS